MNDDSGQPKVNPEDTPIQPLDEGPAPTNLESSPSYSIRDNQDVGSDNNHEGIKSVLSTVLILILAFLIALFITSFVFQSYEVDGPSMETTLFNRDRLIVLKAPRSLARITGHPYIPHRGDVIIFEKHNLAEFGQANDKQLIKRVIGLPGDRVIVKDGILTVYNSEHPNGFQPDKTMPYGSVISTTPGNDINQVIGANEVYVCGDNRYNSLDSRFFGPVPVSDIIGKLVLRIYPINKMEKF